MTPEDRTTLAGLIGVAESYKSNFPDAWHPEYERRLIRAKIELGIAQMEDTAYHA